MADFDAKRQGTGTAEWAEVTENICIGCPHNCLYCFAAQKAATMYGGWCKRDDWGEEKLTKRAEIKSYPAREGVVMFPSTHDITPFNIKAYVRVAKLILEKGNQLLIVSKPHIECIHRLLQDLSPWKDQILFRFTMGTLSNEVSSYWEPGAPMPIERHKCLTTAFRAGFKTSISIEPMLEGRAGAAEVVAAVYPFVTDTIWVGKMNKVNLRVPKGHEAAVERILHLQRDEEILDLYRELKDNEKVRWKDSIKEVLKAAGITP